jgi:hypothetical protein
MLFCHPCGDRQAYGSRLAPNRRRETCHPSVSVVRLLGRPSLKVARHFPQSPAIPRSIVARDIAMRVSACRRRYAPLTMSKLLEKALFQVRRHSAVNVPAFLCLFDNPAIRGHPLQGSTFLPGGSSPGCRSSNPAELILPVYPAPDSAPTKCCFLWSAESKRRP